MAAVAAAAVKAAPWLVAAQRSQTLEVKPARGGRAARLAVAASASGVVAPGVAAEGVRSTAAPAAATSRYCQAAGD